MIFSLLFSVATIAFMIFCLTRMEELLCKIAAGIFILVGLLNILLQARMLPDFIMHYIDTVMRINAVGTALVIISLFKTLLEKRSKGEKDFWYYAIFGGTLLFMLLISFPEILSVIDGQFFYSYYVRIWPEIILITAFLIMKLSRASVKKDQELLLWYFVGASLFVSIFYFVN